MIRIFGVATTSLAGAGLLVLTERPGAEAARSGATTAEELCELIESAAAEVSYESPADGRR